MKRMLRASAIEVEETFGEPTPEKDPDDMTLEELRAFYNKGGANRMQNMTKE